MSSGNKFFRMLFGVIAVPLSAQISIMLRKHSCSTLADLSFLCGCYLFLYLFVFTMIDSGGAINIGFYRKNYMKNDRQTFMNSLINNTPVVLKGYKLMFNLIFLLIVCLVFRK